METDVLSLGNARDGNWELCLLKDLISMLISMQLVQYPCDAWTTLICNFYVYLYYDKNIFEHIKLSNNYI